MNATSWAVGNAVVPNEGADCDADNGWVTSGMDVLPPLSALVAEDARGIAHEPVDTTWNSGPVGKTTSDATAVSHFDVDTSFDPAYTVTWAYVSRDPGAAATSL